MFDTDLDRTGLDAETTLRHIKQMQALAQRAEVAILEDAAHWADLHGVLQSTGPVLPGAEQLIPLGGDGTPPVSEFCPAELGAELGISPERRRDPDRRRPRPPPPPPRPVGPGSGPVR